MQLVEKSKAEGEKVMLERKEKLMGEIEKVRKRADEFNDLGEMDRMTDYVTEVRKLQKRIGELDTEIAWLNKVLLLVLLLKFVSVNCYNYLNILSFEECL